MATLEKQKPPTQHEKILMALEAVPGAWVSGEHFLHGLYLSQYHTRIFELQQKGYNIVASDFTDDFGFKSYKLVPKEPYQGTLI